MQKNTRRAHESQIYVTIERALPHFTSKSKLELIAVDLTSEVVHTIATSLEVCTANFVQLLLSHKINIRSFCFKHCCFY